ncbi:hypothetical protein SDC9_211131 [bioreactor metagenome]|uniref:Uncharacterized protein n=1 Tax=bioreactor metagenome TaxID=1076179 RepID=A0A645JVZ4_9ZZZZ
MHGDAAVAARGHPHGNGNQLACLGIEMTGLLARAGQGLVALHGAWTQLGKLSQPACQFLAVFVPVQHCLLLVE